jgi:Aminopeptidase P, N-terminal domain
MGAIGRLIQTVTPGISALEYATRRSKLAAELPDGAVAVIPAASVQYRSGPVFYAFHQNSDFYYLTGFLEPEAVCVIGMFFLEWNEECRDLANREKKRRDRAPMENMYSICL